jgi:hypothetical protein
MFISFGSWLIQVPETSMPTLAINVAVQHGLNYRENPRECQHFVAMQQIRGHFLMRCSSRFASYTGHTGGAIGGQWPVLGRSMVP